MLGIAFFLWIGMQIHQRITVERDMVRKESVVEPEKVRFSPTLGMMTDMVPELDLSQEVSSGERSAEFRGVSFIKEQANRWTVHIMSVTQEEVIKSYLDKRADRQQFFYVRARDANIPERYVLFFGNFSSVSKALEASRKGSFDLPASVKAYPVRFSDFKNKVTDDVGSEGEIINLSKAGQIYQVRLRNVPVPLEMPSVAANSGSNMASPAKPSLDPLASTPLNNAATGTVGTTGSGQPNTGTGSVATGTAATPNSSSNPKPAQTPATPNTTGDGNSPIADPFN
ncbi:MAG: hypothetical protein EOO68_28935 [Moraxellaceae bacterium]|nr:MAG: hypothetical protein EOO68_28935 [Moraxellaceae bacterium]